ncbi:YceI family protein [Streptomyces sp. NPDC052051]|uniref:YceI family protein n=1 Tax=Streptomyces sp. NPDC052051 TaxID=3154649 RepID=UPI00341EE8CA
MGIFSRKKHQAPPATADTAAMTGQATTDLAALTGEYMLDPAHTSIGFVARHAMVTNVKGGFHEFTGTLRLDGSDPSKSSAFVEVNVASVDTGQPDRDNHLRSSDFFRAAEYPTMTFRSTRAEDLGGGLYRMTGELSILGITKPLTLDLEFNGAAKDPFGNERVGFEGTAQILRSEWGLTWNTALETGGVLVADKIKLVFDISAIRQR